jgi:hypothetical protein
MLSKLPDGRHDGGKQRKSMRGRNRTRIDWRHRQPWDETAFFGSPPDGMIARLRADVQLLAQVQATQELMHSRAHDHCIHV